jgi:single-strand DNA-binding protein
MANDLNQCSFIGRLGRDPETKYLQSGDAAVNFSIASGWKTKDKEGTEWVNVIAFGKLAEICEKYLAKGSQVFVQGRLQTRKWQAKDGTDRYTTEIVADRLQMLGGKPEGDDRPASRQQAPAKAAPKQSSIDDIDENIPF